MNDKLIQITPTAELESEQLMVVEHLKAGFPSPAADYTGDRIDINREVVRHPETTFYARIDGDSMVDAGLFSGDLVVIDRSLEPRNGDFVAAYVDGEFTLKEYRYDEAENCVWLLPHNSSFKPICVREQQELIVWGVVTFSLHKLR